MSKCKSKFKIRLRHTGGHAESESHWTVGLAIIHWDIKEVRETYLRIDLGYLSIHIGKLV